MVKIESFEDIKAWQEARDLAKMVYEVLKPDNDLVIGQGFREQLESAAVSIMSNIAEGFSRRSRKEFIQFLSAAKGSAAEVQSKLYVALDQGYITKEKFKEIYSKSDEVSVLITGFIQYLLNGRKAKADELSKPGEEGEG